MPMMNIFAILIVLLVGYTWLSRGFLSAFLHLLCVIVAGAIALGLWEPVAYWLLASAPERGFFATVITGSAWGVALAFPFAIAVAVLRLVVDKLVPANAYLNETVNAVGGTVCGAGAGVIAAGIFVLAAGSLRVPKDSMGYQAVNYANQGNVTRQQALWFPVDRITVAFYSHLSAGAFATPEPLARWQPDLELVPASLRLTDGDGKNRNTFRPADVKLLSRYGVGRESDAPLDTLLTDAWAEGKQNALDLDGKPFPPQSRLEGFVIEFQSGAKEKFGQVVIGNGPVRLIIESPQGERRTVHPIAVVAQGDAANPVYARFRFDAPFQIASVGGASQAKMAFEFVVPRGFEPLALYVRNIRHRLPDEKGVDFPSVAARDSAIASGSLMGGAAGSLPLDTSGAGTLSTGSGRGGSEVGRDNGVQVSANLGFVLQKGSQRSLEINANNLVVNGEEVYSKEELSNQGIDRKLRIDSLFTTPDTVIVQVDVSLNKPASLLGGAAAAAERVVPPVLIDTNGTRYEAVGFVYKEKDLTRVRYTPGQPIRGLSELDQQGISLSRSRPDQQLTLIFRPSRGSQITAFALGSKVIVDFNPPLNTVDR